MPRLTYPTPPTAKQVDDYHGTSVPDPYRPLEDGDAPESREWISAQNELTESVLGEVPTRREIRARLAELWDFPRAGAPWRVGDRWFQLRNTGLQDQDVLWTADAPDAEGTVLLDPNRLSEHGTTALSAVAVAESGELVACAMSDAGSDWRTWSVRRVATGEELPDRIAWAKFAPAAWTHDDAGFFYGRYPEPLADAAYDSPNLDMELRYHRLGTEAAEDHLVFSTPHGAELERQAEAMEGYFEQVVDTLTAAGYRWYETANFCLQVAVAGGRDLRARHNLGYWHGRDYLGIGIGAVSTISGERRRNASGLARYVAALEARERPSSELEIIDGETHEREKLMLGLRLDEPLAITDVDSALDREALARLVTGGLVHLGSNGRGEEISLTRRGRFLGGGVTAELLA